MLITRQRVRDKGNDVNVSIYTLYTHQYNAQRLEVQLHGVISLISLLKLTCTWGFGGTRSSPSRSPSSGTARLSRKTHLWTPGARPCVSPSTTAAVLRTAGHCGRWSSKRNKRLTTRHETTNTPNSTERQTTRMSTEKRRHGGTYIQEHLELE